MTTRWGGTTGNPELTGEDEGGGTIGSEGETVTVATIGEAKYETLDEAITAVADGETIVVNAGEYTLNGSLNYTGKAFTIAAADGADVSFDMSAAVALHGAKITFNNVIFDYKTNGNYIGLQHADTLVYNNCTINGMVFLYAGNETFNGCTFKQESPDAYNVWTYGAQNVAFNGCTFNCVGKAVLVYNEGAIAKTDLTVTDTKFVASAPVTGKAAIEIDTSLMAGGATITVDDKTTDTGFAAGSNSGKTLWNDKKQTADTNKNTTVTVAGEKVFEPKATVVKPVSVNGTSYETLEDAIDAATPDANGVVTYEISGKVDVTATGWVQVAKSGLTGLTAVKFVGTTDDAKICINGGLAILADQNYDIDVSFEALALSKLNPTYGGDYGHSTNYFTTWLRNSGAAENTVTYTNCTFPNGVSNNQYGKTVFDNCKFTNGATGLYNLWNYGGSTEIKNSSFTGTLGIKAYSEGVDGGQIEVADTTFNGLGEKAAIVVSKATTVTLNKVDATECTKGLLQKDIDGGSLKTTIEANGTGISGKFDITATTTADAAKNEFNISAGTFTSEVSNDYCADGFEVKANDNGTYGVVEAATADGDGTEANPYTLEQLGAMTRQAYIDAQNRLNGTMYVTVGNYAYDTNGVLGNGVRDDTTGQTPDHSKLNAYGENGYLGEKNDGANGKSVVFVGGSITSGVTGYTSIDKIGTSLLLALPAYTNVTFKGITFNNVMSFNYQLYTSPWSQLGELKFDGCTFNGIIVGAIAAQTLTFNRCEFKNYTNTTDANNSNPTWIRPAYGNWTQGDNEGQGSDFRSLTTINFTDNKVTSTRPVKFEYISQWDITSTVTATGNYFDISKQDGDTTIKNVGLYLGAHTDANAFNLVAEDNTKSANTAALYTIPEGKTSLPLGSTVKNLAGDPVELTDALKWKAGDAETGKIVLKTVEAVASVGSKQYGSLQAAINAASRNATVTMLADTKENVTISKALILDLNGFTLNGGTEKGKPALTITARIVTIKDSSEAQTGTIMREDTAENSGVSSHYVIDIQGNGWVIFKSGTVKNGSGAGGTKGASLVRVGDDSVKNYPGLVINGGTFTQDNFIVIKVDRGHLTLNGGTLNSANTYAVENWFNATIKGGTVNGAVSSRTYSAGSNSTLTISGGTVNGDVTSVNYGDADKVAKVEITDGTVNGQLDTRSYDPNTGELTSIDDAAKATIKVSGGTFSSAVPAEYCAAGFIPTANADGTYGVQQQQQVLAKIGDTAYYTMDAAFHAVQAGETIVMQRDYTTGAEQYSGNKSFAIDLNGKTWTYTGTNTNHAAFEINHPNVTLTVTNGTVASNSMVGLIPSAMGVGGTITYDNAGLVFEGVTMTAKGHSGIETNGNNTNDAVTLKNSTLNVPDGFGIYFPSSGKLTIDNSTINAKTMGVQVCTGSLSINAGSAITVIGDAVPKTENDGAIQDGAAISIVNRTGYKGLGDVTVTGGKFTAKAGNKAIKAYDWANKTETEFTAAEKVAVSGGTFSSAVKEEYCATGYIPKDNGDGTYGVKEGVYVAKVDNVKYETLQAAIDAAKGNSTVRLLANVTLTETAVFPAGKTVHLNLVGHNITATGTALRINGTTDIQDTYKTGTIESTGNVAVAVGNNASLTVYSGTLKGREGAVITGTSTGAKIEIKKNATLIATDNAVIAGNGSQRDGNPNTILVRGGTFIGGIVTDGYIACGIYAPWNDNVTVSGGTFNITNGAGIVARAGTVKVTGGTFNCTGTAEGYVGDSKNKVPCAALVFDKAAKYPALTESSQILVSGGSFSTDPAVNGATLAAGYVANKDESGMYKVAKANPVAAIGDVKYDTLQAAITAAQDTKDGATITLLTDINTSSYYEVKGENPVIIDLAGHNITGSGISGLFYVTVKGDLTIKGEGTVTAVEDNKAAMAVWVRSSFAKVTLEGGTYTQQITNTADPHFDLIYVERGNVYVKGGTYKGATPDWTLNCKDEYYQSKEANIEVTGGTFVGFDPANNKAEGENTNFVPAGYVSTKDADGNFVVTEVKVAEVNGVAYATLSEAIAAANAGDTVKLLRDINTPEISYVISKSLTIDLNGMTVTGSGYDAVFQIDNADAKVVIKNGKVVAVEQSGSAGKYTMAIWASKAGCEVTLEGLDVSQKITHTDDPQMDMIYASGGTITINSGNFVSGTPAWTLNCNDTSYKNGTAKIIVTGGTFVGFDPANNKAEGEGTSFVAAGYVSTKGADGNYTVEEYKPVEVWTGYSGAKVASYATVAEAAENLGEYKWIVIGKDYTLTEDFTIGGENLDNLYLDVAEGATLTVAEGVTLTVAANAKRLGVRDGATLVNKGTIVVCGSSTSNGFAMLYGTFTGNELTVPEGCFLDNNGKNFFATANENAVYEITFGDGTVKKTADSTNIKGGNVKQIKLLKDVTNGGWTLDSSSVGAEVVLDLNGHTISYNGANRYYATLNVYTKVTIKNGTVKYEGSKRGAIDLVGQGDLTIERDVTIDGGDGFAIFTSGTSKLTVNGKVTANGNYAIAGNGSKDAGGYIDSCDIIVNGGAVISASKGIAIYHPEKGTVTINGGTITGHTGIEMCAGQLVVNGGSITSNGDNMDATGSQNAILDGAAISIINRNYPGGVPTAVIKGGTFAANGKDAQTVKAYDYTGDKVAEWTAAGDNVNISGGTFSSIPTNMGVLCADGYKTVYDAYADMYNVVKQDAKITVGKRLSIGNDLTITYLVSLTDCTNPWVKFQFYNDDIKGYTTVEVKNYGTDTVTGPDGKPMDVFTFDFTGINPQRMTDTLKATVYAKDANGNVVEYQVDDYSVAQYCSNKLAKLGQNDPLRKLIGNLVAYGAAAQVYQNYRTDNLVSTVVSGAVSTDYTDRLSSVTQYTEKVLGTAGVNIKGKTLVLSNTFAVRVYFTVNEDVDIANVSFNVTANGKTDTVNSFEKDEKLGYYYFDYANLNATQLDSEVKFESFVNETGVGDMVTYSVNTYLAKKMPNYDKSSNAYKLMAELFNYGCACTEYASK